MPAARKGNSVSTTDTLRPAEVFPVGEYLADEIEARGWTLAEFAEIIGRPSQAVSEIVNGHKAITPQTAHEIGAATGTDPGTWLRLQDAFELWLLDRDEEAAKRAAAVKARARLAEVVPLRELIRRGVITPQGADEQVADVCDLLGVESLDQRPTFGMAARRSNASEPLNAAQNAWLGCVRRQARALKVDKYRPSALEALAAGLTRAVVRPQDFASLPAQFAKAGVRLVHVAPFPGGKIDGVAFVDDENPVIGVSARRATFDAVTFTLLHECAHVVLGHVGMNVDQELFAQDGAKGRGREADADRLAASWALAEAIELDGRASARTVSSWANAHRVHPAIVVGRLHHEGRLPWSHLNAMIPNVRGYVEAW